MILIRGEQLKYLPFFYYFQFHTFVVVFQIFYFKLLLLKCFNLFECNTQFDREYKSTGEANFRDGVTVSPRKRPNNLRKYTAKNQSRLFETTK